MKKSAVVLLVFLLMMVLFSCNRKPEKIIGIKIYEYNKDFNQLVDKWKEMGINTAFVSKEMAANPLFRQILKKNNIKVFIIFPVFYDAAILKHDSTLYAITDKGRIAREEWVEFVCPSRMIYRKSKIDEAADIITKLEPDGLSIDFIRQFVFWEKIYPDRTAESIDMACFCDSCIDRFSKVKDITLPDSCVTAVQKASCIVKNYSATWNDFRCDLIASMVKEISEKARSIRKEIKINVHVLPWRDEDFGGANIRVAAQDLQKISPFTDYISPMCYSQMVRRDAGWIESVVAEMDKKTPGKILPSIQVNSAYINDTFTKEDFIKCITAALKAPSQGVLFFSWPLFEKDPERTEIRNYLK